MVPMSPDRVIPKDARPLYKTLRKKYGFSVMFNGGKHPRLVSPRGEFFFLPGSGSDRRGLKNTVADLRRAGYEV